MQNFISQIQPFLSLINAVISLAVLGFIIQLAGMMRSALAERMEAIKDQKVIVEERLKNAQDELNRTEKWYKRDIDELQEQLTRALEKQGPSIENMVKEPNANIEDSVKLTLETILTKMNILESRIGDKDAFSNNPAWHLNKARALANTNDWKPAAEEYGKYLEYDRDNWEVHFLQGVAYQNSREGNHTNLAALRAYNEAVALTTNEIDVNTRARLFAYRGAALKRLGRLHESESDLLFARKMATREYEISDIAYNLACVYAMNMKKQEMLENIKIAIKLPRYKSAIKFGKDYFKNYWEDQDFQHAIQ